MNNNVYYINKLIMEDFLQQFQEDSSLSPSEEDFIYFYQNYLPRQNALYFLKYSIVNNILIH